MVPTKNENKWLSCKYDKVFKSIMLGNNYLFLNTLLSEIIGTKEEVITKYHLCFLLDIKEYLNTLDYLETLKGKLFIPSHVEAVSDISNLITLNRNKVYEIIDKIYDFCRKEVTFEDILKYIFDVYNLNMNPNQYILIGSTIRSYLSYLNDLGKITFTFKDNKMYWKQTSNNSVH